MADPRELPVARLASYLAREELPTLLAFLRARGHHQAAEDLNQLVAQVRREVWRDFSHN